jgi:hypothetical protein
MPVLSRVQLIGRLGRVGDVRQGYLKNGSLVNIKGP